jgi:hypothetical protein
VAKDIQISQYEERRLLTISLACSVQEQVAADQLLHPCHDMLYPARIQLADAYQSLRIECKGKWLALRTYRIKMRDEKTKESAALR